MAGLACGVGSTCSQGCQRRSPVFALKRDWYMPSWLTDGVQAAAKHSTEASAQSTAITGRTGSGILIHFSRFDEDRAEHALVDMIVAEVALDGRKIRHPELGAVPLCHRSEGAVRSQLR